MDQQLHGTYTAKIVETHDPASQGRVRLVIPQLHGTTVTDWARPASIGTVAVGDQVCASFDGGDVNYPIFWPISPNPLPTPTAIGAAAAPGPWVPLTMATGWAAAGTPNPLVSARWVNGTDVQLSGIANYTSGTALTAGTYYTVANLPAAMTPSMNFNAAIPVSWDSGQTFTSARCQVAGGSTALQIALPQTVVIRWLGFDSCFVRTV